MCAPHRRVRPRCRPRSCRESSSTSPHRRSLSLRASSGSGSSTTPCMTACRFQSRASSCRTPATSTWLLKIGSSSRARESEAPTPATAARQALLEAGSDDRFRQLVYDLLTISVRMETAREHLARRLGVSGPQYSILMAIARLQERHRVRVGGVAKARHVTSAFIATETGRLARLGLLSKSPNPKDRRGILLAL